ncbi:Hypothetical predicted protein [Cloeon dipterum]|uniref:Uncharacterized protein n=1 Tax=Cloeon dipterum TaxID=197152 RepID=A0A8S1DMY5_9INSE|nr:Hypothetical predicted protein [Cloeon dipterum]
MERREPKFVFCVHVEAKFENKILHQFFAMWFVECSTVQNAVLKFILRQTANVDAFVQKPLAHVKIAEHSYKLHFG